MLLVLLVGSGCGRGKAPQRRPVESVSLDEVLANAKAFDGRTVRVCGFLLLEFEGNALYRSGSECADGQTGKALSFDIPTALQGRADELSRRRVCVVAEVSSEDTGHRGAYAGTLYRVSAVEPE